MTRIQSRLDESKRVLLDCCLKNGAIVAANSSKPYYPKEAKDYSFVWPRDGSYACVALDMLGVDDVQEKFFKWCMGAEHFRESGVFYENYEVSGKMQEFEFNGVTKYGAYFQPDQTGTLLFAIWHHFKERPAEAATHSELIELAANGLCALWDKTHFKILTQDVWEERIFAFPDMEENFSYSLAACSKGLRCAYDLLGNKRWLEVSSQMKKRLDKHYHGYFYKLYGEYPNPTIDSSALGLVYPFEMYSADDKRMVDTVKEIERKLVKDYGVYRFKHDDYDGWMYKKFIHRRKGSGYWPLLNFFLSIYYARLGRTAKAKRFFDKVFDDTDRYIPEQIFSNKEQKGPSPLAWSHVMFVMAAKELGYF